MNLFEYEGKKLLRSFGIQTPGSHILHSPVENAPTEFPCVLKAQVLTGGRGKAGGIKLCSSQADYEKMSRDIFGMEIKGHKVHALLAEEVVKPEKELYISITLNGGDKPVLMFSSRGGMEIEKVAAESPDELYKLEIEPFVGIKNYQIKMLASKLNGVDKDEFASFVKKLYKAFVGLDATLVEINPLGAIGRKLVAMDAKVVLDDHAERRNADVFASLAEERKKLACYKEPESDGTTITFIPLDGDIGLISDGAGTGMLSLDLLADNGGKVSSFCELGGVTNPEVMYRAMDLTVNAGHALKSIFIVLIGGFNKMDDMANGIVSYIKDHNITTPVFCRMCGTMEEEGIKIMNSNGLKTYYSLMECVKLAVSVPGEKA